MRLYTAMFRSYDRESGKVTETATLRIRAESNDGAWMQAADIADREGWDDFLIVDPETKDPETITTSDTFGVRRTYEIVDRIPSGYVVWNIGENMGSDEHIPICMLKYPGTDDCSIIVESVKAVRMDPEKVKVIREAAGVGVSSLDEARRVLRWRMDAGSLEKRRYEMAVKSLLIYEEITE